MKILGDGYPSRLEQKEKSKCRKWRLRVMTDEGEKTKRFNGTYSQACKAVEQFKAELLMPHSDDRFADCAALWMERRRKSGEIEPETIRKDSYQVKKLIDQFGRYRVDELTYTIMVNGMLEIKQQGNLSNATMAPLYTKARAILNEARKDGKIHKNPMDDVQTPKPEKSKRKPLTVEQFGDFVRTLSRMPLDSHTMALRFYTFGGMRRGEPLALNWDDVDNALIKVSHSYSGLGRVKDTKTGKERSIPMVAMLARDLAEWRTVQRRELYRLGITQEPSTPVITSEAGTRMHPDNMDRWWRQNRDDFGLSGVVLHELRHTFSTLLSSDLNAPIRAICDLTGWQDISTANTYVHGRDTANIIAIGNLSDFVDGIMGGTDGTDFGTSEAMGNVG